MNPSTQAMITEAFNSETYVQNRMDVQHTPLYDTVVLAAGAALTTLSSALFTNVGPASAKTLALTNMSQSRLLPAPEAFSIFGIRFRYSEDILRLDLTTILNTFALEFYLGQKVYNRGPLWFYNAGGGIWAATTRTEESVYVNGNPSREGMHKLAIPIVIENQMTFYGQLVGTNFTLTASASGGTGLTMQCLLDGLYARGVQ
jgi:hypothetical protein